MTATPAIQPGPLPEAFIAGLRRHFTPARLETALLSLAPLRSLNGTRQEEALHQNWLHVTEQAKVRSLHHNKRHIEWLGGRICAKAAIISFLSGPPPSPALHPGELEIIAAASGQPQLQQAPAIPAQDLPHISISHSGEYALALAATSPCGIDIQQGRATLLRVQERFCTPNEEELLCRSLKTLTATDYLTLLWAAKEAIKKSAAPNPMPGFLDLVLTTIQPISAADDAVGLLFTMEDNGRHVDRLQQLTSLVCLHQGYGIGVCLRPSSLPTGTLHA